MKWKHSATWALLSGILFFGSCRNQAEQPETTVPETVVVERPAFNSDSTYSYIETQVNFGPRVPGTSPQKACADWLKSKLEQLGAQVTFQKTSVKVYNGSSVPCYNIIGSYKPEAKKRILLCAHWDSRPWADQDDTNTDNPIDGANDGASGVGVLLEIARQLQQTPPNVGVDIIFFDVEDYGKSEVENSYCLGSQYWSKNPHIPGYKASQGILLDMVGAPNATFALEGFSMQIAPQVMKKVWSLGHELGHGKYFLYRETGAITDDHYYVTTLTGIPTIDIIHNDATTMSGFGKYWHTHDDNMSNISKETLQAVGETVLAAVKDFGE
jgi:Zn-dependent M28 family amino/carboxypeptidase